MMFRCLSEVLAVWTFQGMKLPGNAKPLRGHIWSRHKDTRDNILAITKVQLDNRGHYECEGKKNDKNLTFYARTTLKIKS